MLYHSAFDFRGIDNLTMTSSDGSLGDGDVLNLNVSQQALVQSVQGENGLFGLALDSLLHLLQGVAPEDFLRVALGVVNKELYHSIFDFSGFGQTAANGNGGSIGDTDVLNLGLFQQVPAQTLNDFSLPARTLDAPEHAATFDPSLYGFSSLYAGPPGSTPYQVAAPPDFHLV